MKDGRTPEQVVGNLPEKTPTGAGRRAADHEVMKAQNRDLFREALLSLGVPTPLRSPIEARWRDHGEPALSVYAPYVAHVMTVDLFFYLAIGSELIGRERPSNK